MEILDIVILVVFVGALVYGAWRGLVVQIGAIAGVVVGILFCRLFGDWGTETVGVVMPALNSSPRIAHYINSVIANVVLFAAGYVMTRLLAMMVKAVVEAVFMGVVDRILGALFSVFEWMLVLSLALNMWQAFSDTSVIGGSTLAGGKAAVAVFDLAPTVFGFKDAPGLFCS